MKNKIPLLILFCVIQTPIFSQSPWPEGLLLTPEKSQFQKTSTYKDVVNFLEEIKKHSDRVHFFSMGKSLEGKDIPVAVLANPKVSSAQEAHASGKLIVYIQGNIHAGEVEGKETVMLLMRDILLGDKAHLLDSVIIMFAPIYNTDANDKMAKGLRPSQEDSPLETGERESSQGYDLNRDGMKMEALETRALFQNVINAWDPQIFVDLHTTNGTWHAYSLTWAPSYHSAGDIGPYQYSKNVMLPNITDSVYKKHKLRLGVYGDYFINEGWPPTNFYSYNHHPRYLVNQFGFRNRMAILSEAFAHERFYQRINSTHAFVSEILEYANRNAHAIAEVNRSAEKSTIEQVKNGAGKVKKGVKFKMVSSETLNHFITYDHVPMLDSGGKKIWVRTGKIVEVDKVNYFAGFEAELESTVPRGYIIPARFTEVIENLIMHGIKVEKLESKQNFKGEIFKIDSLSQDRQSFQKHRASTLFGAFKNSKKMYNTGDYKVDMAQPLANLIFYLLEPQSDDGLAHWNFFDAYLNGENQTSHKMIYPIFKYF